MKVLVTGSSGRVGQAIVARLRRRHEVVGFDQAPASVTDVVADLRDESSLRSAMRGADAVVHTAALHAPHVPHVAESEFESINVEGTGAVVRCCLANGIRSLVFTSTTALYGSAAKPTDRAAWVTEDTVPAPQTTYHCTKLKAEGLLRAASQDTALRVTVLRMSRCFPEPAPLMASYRLHRGVDARDVASAHELALLSQGEPFRTYIISGQTPFDPSDALELKANASATILRRAAQLAEAFAQRGWALPESIDRVYASHLAQRELGWVPRFGWLEVLQQFDAESPEVLPPVRRGDRQGKRT